MEISFWWLTAIAAAAMAAGFCMGRLTTARWTVEEPAGDKEEEAEYESRRKGRRDGKKDSRSRFPFSVGSPVSGEMVQIDGDEKAVVAVHPGEDRLYPPANGKITKIFPRGNAFLLRTEFGAEIYIKAGDAEDDLLERYYRPRVVQNEIVGKGKLILEFDRKGLVKEGASCCVYMGIESGAVLGSVLASKGALVKAGEPLLGLRPGRMEDCDTEYEAAGFLRARAEI